MQKLLIVIALISSLTSLGQTQTELNEAEHGKYLYVDKELNSIYQRIIQEYKGDPVFIKNLKTSQKIWIKFRNAEMKMKYPDRKPGYYGSVQPMCWSVYLTELTQERIKVLKLWWEGIGEGDVCAGSVKTKN